MEAVKIPCFHKFQPLSNETAVGNLVMECARGLFSLLHSEQVQWLFDFYVFDVEEVFQTLISNLKPNDFHFTSVPQCPLNE